MFVAASLSHESSLDPDRWFSLRGDRSPSPPVGAIHLPKNMEQTVQIQDPQGDRKPVHILLLRARDHPHPLLSR